MVLLEFLVGSTAFTTATALTTQPFLHGPRIQDRRHHRQLVVAPLHLTRPSLGPPLQQRKSSTIGAAMVRRRLLRRHACTTVDPPYAYSVFDEPIVLWHDGETLQCAVDRCPHRLAALSEGAVEPDGTLRCFYHGWAFAGSGECTAMPQLPRAL